jgi:hypothetical protein
VLRAGSLMIPFQKLLELWDEWELCELCDEWLSCCASAPVFSVECNTKGAAL